MPGTHLEAVKMCLALVQMALIGLSWPLISPMGVKLSTFQTLMTPARQALSSMGRPGTKARAHTQSLCALGICCGRGEGEGWGCPCGERTLHSPGCPLLCCPPVRQAPQLLGAGPSAIRPCRDPEKGPSAPPRLRPEVLHCRRALPP